MLARTHIELGGERLCVHAPETTREILEAEIYHTTRLHEQGAGDDGLPDAQAVADLIEWCARYVEGWSADELDALLNWPDLRRLREAIVTLASLPEDTLSGIQQWFEGTEQSCECPICKGRVDRESVSDDKWEMYREHCLYGDISEHVEYVSHLAAGLGEDGLIDAPFWIYQIATARKIARGKSVQKRREEQDRKQKVDQKLARLRGT